MKITINVQDADALVIESLRDAIINCLSTSTQPGDLVNSIQFGIAANVVIEHYGGEPVPLPKHIER